jgi:hypothetical protein
VSEKYQQLLSSVSILPTLKSTFDYTFEETESDSLDESIAESLRGKTKKNTFNITTSFMPETNGVPAIFFANKSELYKNILINDIAGENVQSATGSFTHSPSLVINGINEFFKGNLSTSLKLDFFFSKNDISRTSDTIDLTNLKNLVSLDETEKRQKNNVSDEIDYFNKIFFVKNMLNFSTEALVQYAGKNSADQGILNDFYGGFRTPFVYDDGIKLVQRDRGIAFKTGLNDFGFITPRYSAELAYRETSFRDYSPAESAFTGPFSRCRDAQSMAETIIYLPINLRKFSETGKLGFIKSLNSSFSRSVYLSENAAPFEGEGTGAFEEEYGITNSLYGISSAGLNLFRYFPGYIFTGRNFGARGRDYVHSTFNSGISSGGLEFSNYDNTLKIIEDYSLNMLLDFSFFTVDTGGSLNQVCSRSNIQGVPQQIITRSANIMFNFDLMEMFDFWFFRPNAAGLSHHSSSLEAGYTLNNHNVITSNSMENEHSLSLGLTFKWDRRYFRINGGIDIRKDAWHEFIPEGDSRSSKDDIYYTNIRTNHNFMELDTGYNFSFVYETDVKWLYNLFASYYTLVGDPIFKTEFIMQMKTYDYTETTSPEPYDLYMLTNTLTLDLHKNVQGSLSGSAAIENFRDVGTNAIYSQVFSYGFSFQFSLIF